MNQSKGSTPNALELLVKDRVKFRLQALDQPSIGTSITCDTWSDAEILIVCDRHEIHELEQVAGSMGELCVSTPAVLAAPAPCDVCGRWVTFRMDRDAWPSFYAWTRRLVDVQTQVPASYWLGVDAVIRTQRRRTFFMEADPDLDYELFLNDVLDLDLLQL